MSRSLNEIIKRICEEKNLDEADVREKIQEKKKSLSGLVSDEGAAHIVASELGLKRFQGSKPSIKTIGSLDLDMSEADIVGRVTNIYPSREFTRKSDGSIGRVQNIVVADTSGSIRVTLWNKTIDSVNNQNLVVGDTVKIIGGIIREGYKEGVEMNIGARSRFIVRPEGVETPDVPVQTFAAGQPADIMRKNIAELEDGDVCEIRAAVTRLFQYKPYYEVCSQCKKRVSLVDEKWNCAEHGIVSPDFNLIVSTILDDGSDSIRCVFFRNNAEKLIAHNAKELMDKIDISSQESAMENIARDVEGKEIIVTGRVKRNEQFDRLEMIANTQKDAVASEEADLLLSALEEQIND